MVRPGVDTDISQHTKGRRQIKKSQKKEQTLNEKGKGCPAQVNGLKSRLGLKTKPGTKKKCIKKGAKNLG